jgi:membrane protein YqaA with SNARE-associated domain
MISWINRSYEWMGSTINSAYADYILCFLFYLEAIFFLPTDPILILYCLERRDRAITYATIALIGSIFGGMTSYALGAFLWDAYGQHIIHNHLVNYILTPERFYHLAALYQEHEWFAIFMAGFTPIPYKAATLAAGFCKISFAPFVICSIIARGSRFYLLAIICKIWGHRIKDSVQKYFNLILLFAVILIALTVWLFT